MDETTVEAVQSITAAIQAIGIAGVLAWGWLAERKRADRLETEIVEDWKRQNDLDAIQSRPPQ
ncbi:MAG: hypothetical protein J3T61_12465 [Candidatus Brocadiales bacterium]|nr:hypothetical protein [Candidatus Bathyanammoxibius sp.]